VAVSLNLEHTASLDTVLLVLLLGVIIIVQEYIYLSTASKLNDAKLLVAAVKLPVTLLLASYSTSGKKDWSTRPTQNTK
jgi:hypothetical protein